MFRYKAVFVAFWFTRLIQVTSIHYIKSIQIMVLMCSKCASSAFDSLLNNLKRDALEIQHPKFENGRLGLI